MDVSIYALMIVGIRGRVSGRLHLAYTLTAYGIYLNCICSCMSQSFPWLCQVVMSSSGSFKCLCMSILDTCPCSVWISEMC